MSASGPSGPLVFLLTMFFFNYIIIFKLNIVVYLFPQLFVISLRLLWFALTMYLRLVRP